MLVSEPYRYRITDFDQEVFRRLVPDGHLLVVAEREIDWEGFRPLLEKFYSANMGQPALDPVRMLKLEYLRYQHNLSDRQVMERTKTDVAFRYFLQTRELIRAEEKAHGNDIQALSIDGAGFNGEMLRELEGAAGARVTKDSV